MNGTAQPARPWLDLYAPGQGADLAPQFTDMLTLFESSLAAAPDLPIVRYFDGGLSLRQLDQAAGALARALQERGFAAGDRLAVYTQNNPAFVIGLVAAWKLGGIAVPVNPMNRERELRYILENAGARALLCLDQLYLDVAREVHAAGGLPLATVVTTSALDWQTRNDARVLGDGPRLPVADGTLDLLALVRSGGQPASLARRPTAGDTTVIT
jgi:long-chain acyl-CoA synthetase